MFSNYSAVSCSHQYVIHVDVPYCLQGRIQDFKLGGGGGAHLKKLRRAKGGAKIFGVFRVKNHDFTPKNHIFPILGGAREIFGVFHVKNHDFTAKKIIFLPILGGGGAPGAPPPPLNPPLVSNTRLLYTQRTFQTLGEVLTRDQR